MKSYLKFLSRNKFFTAVEAVGLVVSLAFVRLTARMLEPYAYRVSGYGWAFAAAAGITALIAFISIFWQARRAAKTDPASSLKKE